MKKVISLVVILMFSAIPVMADTAESTWIDDEAIANRGFDLTGNRHKVTLTGTGGGMGAPDSAVPTYAMYVGSRVESTVPSEMSDGDLGALWLDTYQRAVNPSYDQATGSDKVTPVTRGPIDSGYTQVIDETLDADPTYSTGTVVFVGDKKKVGILLKSVTTKVGLTPAVNYYFASSPDNSTWVSCDVVMTSDGEDAPVSVVTHTSVAGTQTHCSTAYLPEGLTTQYFRVSADAYVTTDVDDTIVSDVWISWQK